MDGQSLLQELALRSLGFKARGRHPNDYTNHPSADFISPPDERKLFAEQAEARKLLDTIASK